MLLYGQHHKTQKKLRRIAMEATASSVAASPVSYTLNGETVYLHPLKFLDWGNIEQWIRSEIVRSVHGSFGGNFSREEQQIFLQETLKRITKISILSEMMGTSEEEMSAMIYSFPGMLRIIHASLRPKVTLAELDEELKSDATELMKMFEIVMRESFAGIELKNKEKGETKNPLPEETSTSSVI
jgi:hypothetical protein